ncbi:hypothetical protein ASESINO_196 [Erwinia phage vB_EamM_Asesino]|uniref:Uncharacterized protein n=1 Tax=Erwinia phage vB_EamM_Asesino TaxID=1883370 RepID=A0A1B2IAA6_9CAUD|nr:hypothetical protein ASESINO_196 [Erwinia phage vB_EamM_Asesino]ANZ48209.1 hypothetical protein ASESINO_196 [Erwinia phage vB_EamM_Asesino]
MAKVIIEQREMDFKELKERYGVKAPRVVEVCEKYQDAELMVFQQDKLPLMVFVKTNIEEGAMKMCCLTNVTSSTLEVDVSLLRRYKDAYLKKVNLVTFDFARSIMVNGCRPAIQRFTQLDEDERPVERFQPFTITQDTYVQKGGIDWLDSVLPSVTRGQEIHLVCYNPAIEHTISRHLVEQHGYQQHRAVYIP